MMCALLISILGAEDSLMVLEKTYIYYHTAQK